MEDLLKMKRKNTVFINRAIYNRFECETEAQCLSHPKFGYMCKCLKCGGGDCKVQQMNTKIIQGSSLCGQCLRCLKCSLITRRKMMPQNLN